MFTRIFLLMVSSFACLHNSHGQIVLKRGDTTYNKWRDAIFPLKSFYTDSKNSKMDTLSGTGFLVKDNDKYYVITAKHVVQAGIYENNQKLINNKLFFRTMVDKIGLLCDFSQPKNSTTKEYLLSSDDEDIAVVSLQNKKTVLNYLLKGSCRPIDIKLLDNNFFAYNEGEKVLVASSHVSHFSGKESIGFGLQIDTLAAPNSAKFVTMNGRKLPGSDGGLIVGNNKLIGLITRKKGLKTNKDIIKNPDYIAHASTLVKAAYILHMIEELKVTGN